MKHNFFSRKTRQLNLLVKKLKLALEDGDQSPVLIERLKLRISLLLKELTGYFSKRQLKGILGSLAVIFGLTFNTNAQIFGAPVQNPFGISNTAPAAIGAFDDVDLDGDGDLDLIQEGYGSSPYGGALFYFENTGNSTAPIFGTPIVDPFGLTASLEYGAPEAADIDNDGDMDLLVGGYDGAGYGQIQYFQNSGTANAPAFAAPVVNPFGLVNTLYLSFLRTVDIDNDGDLDILTCQAYGSLIYFQNTGTAAAPAFALPVVDPFGFVALPNVFSMPTFGDLDDDGDYDLMVGETYGTLNYYENTGTAAAPAFAASVVNPFGLAGVYYYAAPNFVNLDGDCDLDLMAGEYLSTLNYFENTDSAVDGTVTAVGTTITANQASASYQWVDCNNGNAPIPGATSQSYTATANGSYAVEVTALGCTVLSACTDICLTDPSVSNVGTTITATVSGAAYQWVDCNNGNAPIPGATSQSFTATASGSYAVEITANGCTVLSACTDVCVIDVTVSTVGVTMTANEGGATYQWVDCNNGNAPIAGATSQSFTPTANGLYAVEITVSGCTELSACVTISTIGLNENSVLSGVSIYPNPSSGMVTIDLGSVNSASVKVIGMNGQVVYQKEDLETSSHLFELNEAAGIYFVEITALGETQVFKLVKK